MERIESIAAMSLWSSNATAAGDTIALVPTMGYFHDGHASLMRQAARLADHVVVSLFVNPIQFGPNEDLSRYPRNLDRDTAIAVGAGVTVLFHPAASDMYKPDNRTRVSVRELPDRLCGASRPGHFDGVTTVVAKLFHIVRPRIALFGQKDLQQLAIIRKMVEDLNWDIQIIGHPTVREADGLAMSSRNIYLSPDERRQALCLSQSLRLAREMVQGGERDTAAIVTAVKKGLASVPAAIVDYVEIIHGPSLLPLTRVNQDAVMVLAVKIGSTRLIDNGYLMEEGCGHTCSDPC